MSINQHIDGSNHAMHNVSHDSVIESNRVGTGSRRPLIGVPTGREKSQRFAGLPIYIMNQTYIRSLESLGALPLLIPLHMDEQTLRGIFERLDGLLLPGGEDMDPAYYGARPHSKLGTIDSERDRTEIMLTQWAVAAGMPTLGICRGVQVLNVACGGTLYQDLSSERPDLAKHDYFPPKFERQRISHAVQLKPNSKLVSIFGDVCEVNSMHHQGVDSLGYGLFASGHAEDGLTEGIENEQLPFVVGVQWHPEEFVAIDYASAHLFVQFISAAASQWQTEVPANWTHQFWQSCRPLTSKPFALQNSGLEETLYPSRSAVDEAAA